VHGLNIFQHRTFDALFYPPCRVRAEANAALGIEVIDGPYQAQVALFDQIAETHPTVAVFLGDIDDQSEIASHQLFPGPLVVFMDDQPAQFLFLFLCQQGCFVDLFEVFFYGDVECHSLLPPGRQTSRLPS